MVIGIDVWFLCCSSLGWSTVKAGAERVLWLQLAALPKPCLCAEFNDTPAISFFQIQRGGIRYQIEVLASERDRILFAKAGFDNVSTKQTGCQLNFSHNLRSAPLMCQDDVAALIRLDRRHQRRLGNTKLTYEERYLCF